jgi:hypothetical protein
MGDNDVATAMAKMAQGAVPLAARLGFTLDFSVESVESLEQYVMELHDFFLTPECTWTEQMKWSAALTLGGYLGEVIRRVHGGAWQAGTINNPQLVIGQVEITPPEKVMKHLMNGIGDHLGHYYRTIVTCIAASEGKQDRVVVG